MFFSGFATIKKTSLFTALTDRGRLVSSLPFPTYNNIESTHIMDSERKISDGYNKLKQGA